MFVVRDCQRVKQIKQTFKIDPKELQGRNQNAYPVVSSLQSTGALQWHFRPEILDGLLSTFRSKLLFWNMYFDLQQAQHRCK